MAIHDEPELTEFDTAQVIVDLDSTQPCAVGDTQPIRSIRAEMLPDVIVLPRIGRYTDDEIDRIAIEIARLFERKAKRKANIWARILKALGL